MRKKIKAKVKAKAKPLQSRAPAPSASTRQHVAKSEKSPMSSNPKKMLSTDGKSAADAIEAMNGSMPADVPGVDKIRELLFGNQMQDYDRRFSVMEDRFLQKLRDVESETSRGLTSVETSIKKQMESMSAQFRNDKDVLTEADKALDRGLREQIGTLDKRIGQAVDQLGQLEREFMERLERAAQEQREETKRRSEDLHATIERMFSELSNVKTDRNLLAGLFVEIARCLNQEGLPKGAAKGGNAEGR
jgi:hypothetical protein